MKTRAWIVPQRLLTLGLAVVLAAPAAAFGRDDDAPKKASVDGKYSKLLKKIEVAADKDAYGEFNDWGYDTTTAWAGYNDLPPGYWVYVAPNWYIWGEKNEKSIGGLTKASVDGKYSKLLKKIEVAADKDAYGEFNDYGRWDGTEWAGYKDLPPGYWVYVAPNWYIWGEMNVKKDGGLTKASVGGKYSKLLKKIEVAADKDGYGEFNDWGYDTTTEWAGYKDLPPGYWVYVAPNWYIWGEKNDKDK